MSQFNERAEPASSDASSSSLCSLAEALSNAVDQLPIQVLAHSSLSGAKSRQSAMQPLDTVPTAIKLGSED